MNTKKMKAAMRWELRLKLDQIVDDLSDEPMATVDDLLSLGNHLSRWQRGIRTLLTLRQYDEILNNEPDE